MLKRFSQAISASQSRGRTKLHEPEGVFQVLHPKYEMHEERCREIRLGSARLTSARLESTRLESTPLAIFPTNAHLQWASSGQKSALGEGGGYI